MKPTKTKTKKSISVPKTRKKKYIYSNLDKDLSKDVVKAGDQAYNIRYADWETISIPHVGMKISSLPFVVRRLQAFDVYEKAQMLLPQVTKVVGIDVPGTILYDKTGVTWRVKTSCPASRHSLLIRVQSNTGQEYGHATWADYYGRLSQFESCGQQFFATDPCRPAPSLFSDKESQACHAPVHAPVQQTFVLEFCEVDVMDSGTPKRVSVLALTPRKDSGADNVNVP